MGAATTAAPYGFWATNPTKKLAHWVYLLGQPLSRNRVFQNFSGEPPPLKKEATKKLSWSRISSDEIMKYSLNNIDWNYSSDILNTEEMWSELHSKLSDIIDIVPVLRVDSNNRPLNPKHALFLGALTGAGWSDPTASFTILLCTT